MSKRWNSLRDFLNFLESEGDLKRIRAKVSPILEISALTAEVARKDGPCLFFENVEGSNFPVVTNILGTKRRISWVIGREIETAAQELEEIAKKFFNFKISNFCNFKTLKIFNSLKEKIVPSQCITKSSLSELPVLKCWPKDGGKFITLGVVTTKDPETGIKNFGIYRLQVLSENELILHWQVQKGGGFHYEKALRQGKPLEVAVFLGGNPAAILAGALPLPEGFDELRFMSFLCQRKIPLSKCQTVDLAVPASADFVFEGLADQNKAMEGPFGDHFGYYSFPAEFPKMKIRMIRRREQPIYPAAVVGRPPLEDKAIGEALQVLFRPLIKMIHPEINDLWAYFETGFHNLLVVSVKNRFAKEGMKTALSLLGEGQLALNKVMILVDESVNAKDFTAVLGAIRRNVNFSEDIFFIRNTFLDTLDFTSDRLNRGGRMVIDASVKRNYFSSEKIDLPDPRQFSEKIKDFRLIAETMLVVKTVGDGKEIVEKLISREELTPCKIIVAVSEDIALEDRIQLLWGIFTRFDCTRDIYFKQIKLFGNNIIYEGPLGIDATMKDFYPEVVEMDRATHQKIKQYV